MQPKSVKTVTSRVFRGDSDQTGTLTSFLEYDKEGNVVCALQYTPEGGIESKTISSYRNGKLVMEANYLSEDEIAEKYSYFRSEKEELEKVEVSYADGSVTTKVYTRDEENNTVSITSTDDEGELEEIETFLLDARKEVLERCVYNEEEQLTSRVENEYNEANLLVKQKEYDASNSLVTETTFAYNEAGNITGRWIVTANGKLAEKIILRYDEKGNLAEQQVSDFYIVRYQYNDAAKVTLEERFTLSGNLESQTFYEYDEHMMLVKEISPAGRIVYSYEFFE
jgi:hypothetical protein